MQRTVEVTLVDALGKKVMTKRVPEGDHEYDVSSLKAGVYYMIAETHLQSKVIMLNKL